ncbi:MAG TPA: class I SAM-dependent methyltransferase [Acidimicrobiia bacterium]
MTSLEQELQGPPWIYPWRLRDGSEVRVANSELPSIHRTRAALIEPRVRAALAAGGPGATALDLACNEGWFSQRLLDWGASRVVAVDVREKNLQRAAVMRDHFDISPEALELRQADVFEIEPAELGEFDVVLVLGLIYHVENPMGVLRLARGCTKGLCAIESQLTRQTEPIVHGLGQTGEFHESEGSLAVQLERGDNALASTGRVLSLIPNRTALAQMAQVAGFDVVEFATPLPDHNPQYVSGNRAVLFAR